jgi:polyhydroxyalkanoate synthesis regulator phasin
MKVASSSVNTPQSINKQNATASILNSLENGMTILKKEMRGITFDDSKIQSLKLKFPEKLSTLSSLGVIRSVAKEMTKDIEMMMSQGNVSEEAIKKTVDDLLKKVKEIFGEIKQGIKGDIIKAALKDLPELMNKLFKTEADENNTIDGVLKEFSMEMNKMFTEQKESQLA